MPLVNMQTLLTHINERNSMAPAFNTTNLETTLAILDGLNESGYPGIIQITPTNLVLSGYEYVSEIVRLAEQRIATPVTLHLDHGKNMEDIIQAVESGFQSVMIDGSELNFEDNIRLTKEASVFCKRFNVAVEAELGAIAGKEDDHTSEEDAKTNPILVKEFVLRSGCDLLAISIGNIHGLDEEPNIDFELLEKISRESPVPLVLHGGSGLPTHVLRRMRSYNVVKVNIASELRRNFITTIGKFYQANINEHNLAKVLLAAKQSVKDAVVHKTKSMNS